MDLFSLVPVAVIMLPISWTWIRMSKIQERLDNTYNKGEVKELIDLKNQPIIDAIERNTESQAQLALALDELRKELHRHLFK